MALQATAISRSSPVNSGTSISISATPPVTATCDAHSATGLKRLALIGFKPFGQAFRRICGLTLPAVTGGVGFLG